MSSKANAMRTVSSPTDLRNVVLVGSAGSGKTTLFENLLRARIPGYRGERDDAERASALTLATIGNHNDTAGSDVVINLLDSPGHPDFYGDLRAGLRAADGAVFVVSAADGVDPITAALWAECAEVNKPRAIVVTKLDTDKADFFATTELIHEAFGAGTHPAYLPLLREEGGEVIGNISLLTGHVHDYSSGQRVTRDTTPLERAEMDAFRADYVESIITESEDEDLLERYFNGDDLETGKVVEALFRALYHGTFFPVIPVLMDGIGVEELLGMIHRGFPMPNRRVLPAITTAGNDLVEPELGDPAGPLVAQVIRTVADPYAGRLSMVRIYSGTLRTDATVHVAGHREAMTGRALDHYPDHDDEERVGQITVPVGTDTAVQDAAIAGQIVYVARMAHAQTSDTLSDTDAPMVVEPWPLPRPLLPLALHATSRNDDDKLSNALQRLLVEDPTVSVERDPATDQLVLWTMGQAHLDLLLARLTGRYGVNVEREEIKIPLRETFIAETVGHGRHVKQSGGHGQYALANVRIEPGERGSGFVFAEEVVGGSVPRQFIPSVEKGVRTQLDRGVLSGYPVVDVKVTLTDGKAHSVDSSDMAFQAAGAAALRDAASAETVALLEPFDEVTVVCGNEYVGAVMTDLGSRRGRVTGQHGGDDGRTTVTALVPASELTRYAIDLRGLSHGTGRFEREPAGYELMPPELAQQVLDERG
ncbi:elongation factor G-like protein EF-G2 [Propionibacterium freudenreichii]|uniref:elongation factor G-like protein EF-G2 n=2 Tax=Propionibacterium freudenreichii TaxID=1744 RepID=UPI000BEF109C|nr:elongation factor G-like protein EF-G2 [Propionibacterium freudenreichii]MDK9592690.1 elongation factor G-like protein EF-G2 [Propionibacterium freudenreichii]WFF33683.1 elongation factor G-like protein EF-G2 [Propionibacterium freudenreichii]WFF35914.1 elongation factor G-like protein EF-G2 [Propionibacterium freudenreichii]